jgi:crotonyl-CoA carboxylase/reductase
MAQFTKVQEHQCLPKADHLTWEEAAAPTLTGGTAYRMLFGWPPHTVQPGDLVLVWGGAGGLGSLAIQLVANAGGRAIAVVGSAEKASTVGRSAPSAPSTGRTSAIGACLRGGRAGVGGLAAGAKAFGKAIWEAAGEKTNPRIVFEHPGEDTIPTSNFVCDRGGMIVICAGTSGYDTLIDVRYLWYLQKRYQGSHLMNTEQAAAFKRPRSRWDDHDHARRGVPLRPDPSRPSPDGGRWPPEGNVSCLVNAPRTGLTTLR